MIGKIPVTLFKVSSVVFLSATIVFALKYIDENTKNEKLKNELNLDSQTYSKGLRTIFDRYDAEVLKNKNQGVIVKEKVVFANQIPVKVQNLAPVKQGVSRHKWDSLRSVLDKRNLENLELSNQVKSLVDENKGLQRENNLKESALAATKNLTATNVYANGIKIVSNNIIETKRFNATEQIKVCFTLLENKAALKGNKDIYIQIVNPNNIVISKNGEPYQDEKGLFTYSVKTNVFYDNEELDVCVFVDPNKKEMVKGDYEINIFSGINLIGSTVFALK